MTTTSAPDLNLLRTFVETVRTGSVTAAARSLGISQPTASAHVQALERAWDRRLFERVPRGLRPTAFASELAQKISGPLDALAGLHDPAAQDHPPVALAGPSELMCTRVLPGLAPLVRDGVQLRVQQGRTDSLLEQVADGRQDLVITIQRPTDPGLRAASLADEEYVMVAVPGQAETVDNAPDPITALARLPLVAHDAELPLIRRFWLTVLKEPVPAPPTLLTVPNLHAVTAAVVAGAGYSVLPESMAAAHLEAGRLRKLLSPQTAPLNTFFVVDRLSARHHPDVVRVRAALIRDAATWGDSVPEDPARPPR